MDFKKNNINNSINKQNYLGISIMLFLIFLFNFLPPSENMMFASATFIFICFTTITIKENKIFGKYYLLMF